ncbi:magnesium-transporting ATPase (P-type) [Clostridium punense]|uniref:Magnesium-transporting ATPase (P-type) n=1 Tax=Clostridium punense TaxID=1054297 RepID=A0ABS4JZN0_9CLOT|nr:MULTISPECIES: hypothetical protein [Clostridium]EQB87013.1 hypothetical protein M918_11045 [Clostridium sp. BL8]MBP2020984.1 magnesium-transporting ATPase (P-type) [Clostridium punense]
MRKFIYLVNTELNRVLKFFIPTLIVYVALQIIQILIKISGVMRNIRENAYSNKVVGDMMNYEDAIKSIGKAYNVHSFLDADSIIIMGFLLIIGLILIYSIFIWYREWFGNNRTIYTLLMIPMERMKIYYAKLLSIILLIGTALGTLIISFFINYMIMLWRVPKDLIEEAAFSKLFQNYILSTIVPVDYRDFLLYIVIGLGLLTGIFLMVLLERSYRFKGLFAGITLIGIYLFTYLLIFESGFFFIKEALIVSLAWGILNFMGHVSWSKRLITKKISV